MPGSEREAGAATLPAALVDRIYDRRARHYDLLHTLTTSGMDRRWRREAAWLLGPRDGAAVLDICTGIGLSALELARVWRACGVQRFRVLGIDYNRAMLARGRERIEASDAAGSIELAWGDVTDLQRGEREAGMAQLADESFDAALSVCGVGGLERPERAFREALRVLKPGGRLVVVDVHRPIPALQSARRLQGWIWHSITRPLLMRRLWGWNDPSDFADQIAAAEWTEGERRWRFETLAYQVRCERWWGLPFCWVAIYLGRKVAAPPAAEMGANA